MIYAFPCECLFFFAAPGPDSDHLRCHVLCDQGMQSRTAILWNRKGYQQSCQWKWLQGSCTRILRPRYWQIVSLCARNSALLAESSAWRNESWKLLHYRANDQCWNAQELWMARWVDSRYSRYPVRIPSRKIIPKPSLSSLPFWFAVSRWHEICNVWTHDFVYRKWIWGSYCKTTRLPTFRYWHKHFRWNLNQMSGFIWLPGKNRYMMDESLLTPFPLFYLANLCILAYWP